MKRFWDKIDKRGPDECWPWKGSLVNGYGQFWLNGPQRAHRLALELTSGPIPKGRHVLHNCDNRQCCNPAHLRTGTHADNMADTMKRHSRKDWGTLEGRHNALVARLARMTAGSR